MDIRNWLNQAGWLAAIAATTLVSASLRADEPAPAQPAAPADAPVVAAAPAPAPEAKPAPQAAPAKPATPTATPKPPVAPESPQAVRGKGYAAHAARYQIRAVLAPVPKPLDVQLDLKGEGALVAHVDPNGPAAKAGIRENDVIVAVGDNPIKKGRETLLDAVGDKPVTKVREFFNAFEGSEGKEVAVKLIRGGKPLTVSVTPESLSEKLRRKGYLAKDQSFEVEVEKIEKRIREKLNDSGIDMKMQFVLPGKELPKGAMLNLIKRVEFPDDLSVTIRKQGKNPADVEVKRGDKTWNVKENDLAQLPDDVRGPVESLLGRAEFSVTLPGVHKLPNLGALPRAQLAPGVPAPPSKDEAQKARDGEKRKAERAERAARSRAGAERRLEAVSGQLERLHRELEGLRKSLSDKETTEEEEEELEIEIE
jgi:hypothetical protein